MLETSRIDLSIPYNQKMLITTFNEYFTLEELEQIDIFNISCPADAHAIKACNSMKYEKEMDSSSFKIKCVLNVDKIPPEHHLKLEFCRDGLYQTQIECNPNYLNPVFMSTIICKSINFSKFKTSKDSVYNRRSIIDGVAKRIAEIVPDINTLIFFRGRMAEELYISKLYKTMSDDAKFYHESIDYKIKITTIPNNSKILKVELYSNTDNDYVYFERSDLGLNTGLLSLDKAIVMLKEKKYIDNDVSKNP